MSDNLHLHNFVVVDLTIRKSDFILSCPAPIPFLLIKENLQKIQEKNQHITIGFNLSSYCSSGISKQNPLFSSANGLVKFNRHSK